MQIRKFNDVTAPLSPKTLEEWKELRKDIHENLKFSTSIELLKHDAPLDVHILPVAEYDDIVIEKVMIQTLPGFYLGGNIYRPKDTTKKYPVVLCPHGHCRHGRIETTVYSKLVLLFANIAKRGMVAFSYDMIGYNDTSVVEHDGFNPENKEYEKYNYGRFSLQLNNGIKALDFVSTLPYVDTERIGCTGSSGGGTQTFVLTAYDERVTAAAPVNQVSGNFQGGCICENIVFLRTDYNNVDLTMMCAPRNLLVASSDGDWTVNSPEVEFPAIKNVYSLYGAEDKFEGYYRIAPHCYETCTREKAYEFFCKSFGIENKYDKELEYELGFDWEELVLKRKLLFGSEWSLEGKIKDEKELFELVKKLIAENLKKLTPEERENINNRVFALSKEFYFDIPYIINYKYGANESIYRIKTDSKDMSIVMGKCPEKSEPPFVKYYHVYNFAEDTKRVNGIIKLFEKYPDAEFVACGKAAALCEIAQKITGKRNLKLTDIDASDIDIPGFALLS